eukprot:CAMPEP_0206217940 /NCGR_PEP_ID=MMETSP0047_2-20121206/3537_1 /ASSEMBLY_ACC=CAM_ASM_000192 /TAXON_ID=195065 /ORGANISM="Chroomonas mesostigmatica_cf, Strain CCMP1168" /LENGTH=67 /DNA_ID=CAMNT_0053640417 /DNA_START=480 /DNA_END=679 /DNA_ORIENTATION=+
MADVGLGVAFLPDGAFRGEWGVRGLIAIGDVAPFDAIAAHDFKFDHSGGPRSGGSILCIGRQAAPFA